MGRSLPARRRGASPGLTTIRDRRGHGRRRRQPALMRHVLRGRRSRPARPAVGRDLLDVELERQLGQRHVDAEICLAKLVRSAAGAGGTFGSPSAVSVLEAELDLAVGDGQLGGAVERELLTEQLDRGGDQQLAVPLGRARGRAARSARPRWRSVIVPVPSTVAATTSPWPVRSVVERRLHVAGDHVELRDGRSRPSTVPCTSRSTMRDLLVVAGEHLGEEREAADVDLGRRRTARPAAATSWRTCSAIAVSAKLAATRSATTSRPATTISRTSEADQHATAAALLAARVSFAVRSTSGVTASLLPDGGQVRGTASSWRTPPARRARTRPAGPACAGPPTSSAARRPSAGPPRRSPTARSASTAAAAATRPTSAPLGGGKLSAGTSRARRWRACRPSRRPPRRPRRAAPAAPAAAWGRTRRSAGRRPAPRRSP